ncbi:MAG: pseudouridine synthase, partial [Methanothrix sp.]
MTKHFEVVRRDGPARMGKLLTEPQISTPALITKDDYVSAGSVYSYATLQDAINAAEALRDQKKLAILPFVPAALRSEPALELPPLELAGPKGVMVHPLSATMPEKADVYVLGSAGALKNPRYLMAAVVGVREKIAPDTALYAPALATPANLALLVYLGIDLLDGTRVLADGLLG